MTRPLQEILDNAEALARAFEDLGPDTEVEVFDGAPLRRILAAARARAAAEQEVLAAVVEARQARLPWDMIGSYLGTSGEAARQRYGALIGRDGLPKQPTKKAAPAAKKVAPAKRAAPAAKKIAPAKRPAPAAKKAAPRGKAAVPAKKATPTKKDAARAGAITRSARPAGRSLP
jgi:hypothetical protein